MPYNMTNDELLEAVSRITPQWLAGFFDGEGCICVNRNSGTFQVTVSQKDVKILSLIALRFGGSLLTEHGAKGTFRVQWTGRTSVPLLEYIKEHVICKKRQVEAALQYAETLGTPGMKLPFDVINKRRLLAEVITSSNKYEEGSLSFYNELKEVLVSQQKEVLS